MPVKVSLYAHAWQALLMLLAGLLSVLASFVGYLRMGGGELLLQQALISFLPTGGQARFRATRLDLKKSTLTVYDLSHSDITQLSRAAEPGGPPQESRVSGLLARECEVKLTLWPWPPRVESVRVRGMPSLKITVQPAFLQDPENLRASPRSYPIHFDDVNLALQIGDGPWLRLEECSGRLDRVREGGQDLTGEFNLRRFNGRPFQFNLASLANGRWELRGSNLEVDTTQLKVDRAPPGTGRLDPAELLLRALLTGDCEAKGLVPELRLVVQPAAGDRPFACYGEVAYQGLFLRLPPQTAPSREAVPRILDLMLGARKTLWPRWLMADSILFGRRPDEGGPGRVAFHMYGRRLEFACDEGLDSAFVVSVGQQALPRLEGLKGSVTTDSENRPQEILLRAFLGDRYRTEIRVSRGPQGSRVAEGLIEPRVAGPSGPDFGAPLYRFLAHVEDYRDLEEGAGPPDGNLIRFNVEAAATRFSLPSYLPPGVQALSGRLNVRGRFTQTSLLALDNLDWEDGGIVYGGPLAAAPATQRQTYGAFPFALKDLWNSPSPWRLEDGQLRQVSAEVQFDREKRWQSIVLKGGTLVEGRLVYQGFATELGGSNVTLAGQQRRLPGAGDAVVLDFSATAHGPAAIGQWAMRLKGRFEENGDGTLSFEEQDVPLDLHPERSTIPARFIKESGGIKRVHRTTVLTVSGGQATRETKE